MPLFATDRHHHQAPAREPEKWTIPSCAVPITLLLLLTCTKPLLISSAPDPNPHQPYQLTWKIINLETHESLNETSSVAPLNTWFPDLFFNLDQVAGIDDMEGGEWRKAQRRISVSMNGFYACPGFRTGSQKPSCGGMESLYCKAWSCVTTNDGEWRWKTKPWYIEMSYVNPCTRTRYSASCNLVRIRFTEAAKKDPRFTSGLIWGLYLYQRPLFGIPFQIKLVVTPIQTSPVGPSKVLPKLDSSLRSGGTPKLITPAPSLPSETSTKESATPVGPNLDQRLLNLIYGAYSALNSSNPNLTESCWLCLASSPPYYEGIAFTGGYNLSSSHSSCSWGTHSKLTLTEVSGNGSCVGSVPRSHQHLCSNTTFPSITQSQYLIPHHGWWACNTGLTPCLSTAFNSLKDYCVMVQLIPRVLYHTADAFEDEFSLPPRRFKREPVSLTLAVLLGLGVTAGVGTGTAALIQGSTHLNALRASIDEDLKIMEQSISSLEKSLTSLSEVVLQNRRGLDLLFLEKGGLCAALKEECCFYSDHTGVTRDSMSKLRERLEKRQRDREAHQGWFESWYAQSPWLTTLVSTLIGPLIILLLILTFGPCILNRLIAFIRERTQDLKLLVLRTQYQPVYEEDGLIGAESRI